MPCRAWSAQAPREVPRRSLSMGDHNRLHARLVTAMDQFIISHEQAHVLLGHVDANPVSFSFEGFALAASEGAAPSPTNTAILIQIRTHAQEFEADAVGYELMV